MQEPYFSVFSWRSAPYLMLAGLCVGALGGLLNYRPTDRHLQLAPQVVHLASKVDEPVLKTPVVAAAETLITPSVITQGNSAASPPVVPPIISQKTVAGTTSTSTESRTALLPVSPAQVASVATNNQMFNPLRNYQVAVQEQDGIRLKTIANR